MNIFDTSLDNAPRLPGPVPKLTRIEEPKCEGEAPIATGDFITDYVKYADVIEAPPEAHEAVAISLLAAVLNEKVHIEYGELKAPLDLWILLLSTSGFGRNTLVSLTKSILQSSGVKVVRNTMWGSRENVFQSFAQEPFGLFVWPELSSIMKKLSDAKFGGVKEWITDLYDNWDIPSSITYRETGKKSDTPPIIFKHAPRINLLATSSLDWFVNCLDQDDTTGGFIPRWVMVKLKDPKRLIPKPKPTNKSLIGDLAAHLRLASELEGVADFSEVEDLYAEWYEAAHGRFKAQPNEALAMPFYRRMRVQILKFAVVYEVSRSLGLQVSREAMGRAIEMMGKIESAIFELLTTGMTREGSEVDKIAEQVKAAGPEGISKAILTRATQHLQKHERDGRISTLVSGEIIYPFNIPTEGRPAQVFVYKDWVEEFRERNLPPKKSD
ncbi:MAG: hypothetical protein ACLGJB_11465 [Blastocatellia bacterium]